MTRSERDTARLLDKIRVAGVAIPEGARCERTYTSAAQRSAGAWAWFVVDASGGPLNPDVGSQWPRAALRGEISVSWDHYTGAWQVDPA